MKIKKKKPSIKYLLKSIKYKDNIDDIIEKILKTYEADEIESINEIDFPLFKEMKKKEIISLFCKINRQQDESKLLSLIFFLYNILKYESDIIKKIIFSNAIIYKISFLKNMYSKVNNLPDNITNIMSQLMEMCLDIIYNNIDMKINKYYDDVKVSHILSLRLIYYLSIFTNNNKKVSEILTYKMNSLVNSNEKYSIMDLFITNRNGYIFKTVLNKLYNDTKNITSSIFNEKYKFLIASHQNMLEDIINNTDNIADNIKNDLLDKNQYGITMFELIILSMFQKPIRNNTHFNINIEKTIFNSIKDTYLNTFGLTIQETLNLFNKQNREEIENIINKSNILKQIIYITKKPSISLSIADLITNSSETVEYNEDSIMESNMNTVVQLFTKHKNKFSFIFIYDIQSLYDTETISTIFNKYNDYFNINKIVIEEVIDSITRDYTNISKEEIENIECSMYENHTDEKYSIILCNMIYIKKYCIFNIFD